MIELRPLGHDSPLQLSEHTARTAALQYLDPTSGLATGGARYYPAAAAGRIVRRGQRSGVVRCSALDRPDGIGLADIGWGVLLAGQPRHTAAASLLDAGSVQIKSPDGVSLAEATEDQLELVVGDVLRLCGLPGIGLANAVKMLHVHRPSLVPVLDRTSAMKSYFDETWQLDGPMRARKVTGERIRGALAHLRNLLADPAAGWHLLDDLVGPTGPGPFTRIQLFDIVWWSVRVRPSLRPPAWSSPQ